MTHRQILQALSGLLLALFISTASATIVTTALPRMIGDLRGSQTQYTWVVTATLLTTTATMPIWGKLADLFNKKTLLQAALVIFVLASVAAGFSQSAGQLIAARAVQGVGVGGLQTLVQVAIGAMIAPRERGRYAGYQSSSTALATIGGPLLGGLIVGTPLGWRWCFFLGVPVAVVAFYLLHRTLDLPTIVRDEVRIDYAGATLIATGVSVLLVWISFVDNSFAWLSWQTGAMTGGGVLLLAIALLVESRAAEPVIPLGIVRQRTVALAILGSLAAGTGMYGTSVFLSQYFQLAREHTPVEAGLLTVPMMTGLLVSSVVGGRLVSRTGRVKPFLLVGMGLMAVGFAGLSLARADTPYVVLGVAMALNGAGVGLSIQNFVLLVQNSVALKDIGAATSSVSFFRSLGGTIGVAVLGAVLAHQVAGRLGGHAPAGSEVAALPDALRGVVQQAYGAATGHVFLLSTVFGVIGLLAALALRPVSLRTTLDIEKNTADAVGAASGVR